MTRPVLKKLQSELKKIDRPGFFCTSGSAPVVLPGLTVPSLGSLGLPLTPAQAEELKRHCEQAPYGKGEETLVDTSVRRVWRMKPDKFQLTNPDWNSSLAQIVHNVQIALGLEKQQLESHLYDLLLYEPGSFFLPHRDGEKLDRMVATLVVVLPSAYEGGELIVRHDGQERTIDFTDDNPAFRLHYAAFYADCEHEIRPLKSGYRLSLVYNLTLTKGKKTVTAPSNSANLTRIVELLAKWAETAESDKLVIRLDHRYTKDGLKWDALKGVDRVQAQVLTEAAKQSGCNAYLAMLSFHEQWAVEEEYGGWYDQYSDDEESDEEDVEHDEGYELIDLIDDDLFLDEWSDPEGNVLPFGHIAVDREEVLNVEGLQKVKPEVEVEGYTGNEGQTMDRWYRHAGIVIWPKRRHFNILCQAGPDSAVASLLNMVTRWQNQQPRDPVLYNECRQFAEEILAHWIEQPYTYEGGPPEPQPTWAAMLALDDVELYKGYFLRILARDATRTPGASLVDVCRKHGWTTFQKELTAVLQATTYATLPRNLALLDAICEAKERENSDWVNLCAALTRAALAAFKPIQEKREEPWERPKPRPMVLPLLVRSLLASEQEKTLDELVEHILAHPQRYDLVKVQIKALLDLEAWLLGNVESGSPALSRWIAACSEGFATRTATQPQPPADARRSTEAIKCGCADCGELKRFLADPVEREHRLRIVEKRRRR